MNIMSFLYIAYILYVIFKYKNSIKVYTHILAVDVVISTIVEVGYFIRIGSFDVDYSYVSQFLLLFYSFFSFPKIKLKRKEMYKFLWVLMGISISLILYLIFPYSQEVVRNIRWDDYLLHGKALSKVEFDLKSLMEYLKLIIFILNLLFFYALYKDIDIHYLISEMAMLFKASLVYGFIELLINNALRINFFNEATSRITGTSDTELSIVYMRGGWNCIQGLTKEPSHYVFSLFIVFILLWLEQYNNKKDNKGWMFLTLLLILFSRALSCIIILAALFLFCLYEYIFSKKNSRYVKLLCIVMLTFPIIVVGVFVITYYFKDSYYFNRINGIMQNLHIFFSGDWKYQTYFDSGQIRLISVVEIMKIIIQRPLFGIGLGATSAHSSLLMSISAIGLFGMGTWVNCVFGMMREKYDNTFYFFVLLFVFVNILGSNGIKILFGSFNIVYILYLNFHTKKLIGEKMCYDKIANSI